MGEPALEPDEQGLVGVEVVEVIEVVCLAVGTLVATDRGEVPAGSLIVLPEMFATGFSMNADSIAEVDGGETESFLRELAVGAGATVVAGNQDDIRFRLRHPGGNRANTF